MKTLVIHPNDITTNMLRVVYADIPHTLINYDTSASGLNKSIKEHDRIIMLGHGSPYGLYGYNKFVIDMWNVQFLRDKELVCVWCYADEFVKKYKLKAICTGMIISEWGEAEYLGILPKTSDDIDISNTLFSEAIKQSIQAENPKEVYNEIYNGLDNPIIDFNKPNFYDYRLI